MAIILNDNIRVNAGKPLDAKYLNLSNAPYSSIAEVNTTIAVPERHIGLTVNINGIEHWYKNNVFDGDLVIKSTGGGIGTITGATNIGFFSGFTSIQTLRLLAGGAVSTYGGDYASLYNFYYRDINGIIKVGTPPIDNIPKRAYLRTTPTTVTWIWNENENDAEYGWVLVNGNIDGFIGQFAPAVLYYPPGTAYVNTSFTQGAFLTNGSLISIDVIGNLTSGDIKTVGGAVFSRRILGDTTLEFRTIRSITPTRLTVCTSEAFVDLGVETVSGANIGTGAGLVFGGLSGNNLQFRRIKGGGDTVVTTSGNDIIISTVAGGSGGGISDGSNLGGGAGVFSNVNDNIIEFRTIVGSGDTTVTEVGDNIVIYSESSGIGTITGATNGLSLFNNDTQIGLGGELDGDTYIDANDSLFEINGLGEFWLKTNDGHEVYFSDEDGFVLTGSTPFILGKPTSLVTRQYVDDLIGNVVETSGGTTVILPSNPNYRDKYIVVDVFGDAESNPITISGNGNIILNDSEAFIDTNYGSITFYFNNQGFWSVIGFTN